MGEADEVELLKQQLENKVNELATANAQISKLRKTTIKQLSAISSITKPLFELDSEYFGGKYQDREDGSNPFQEIQLAVDIVKATRQHFSGQGAMLDTPHLRDQLGSLLEAVESARDAAIDMERKSLKAVGLPTETNSFAARAFPEDNPVAFIVDTAEFSRELQTVCERTAGRIQAMVTMLQEADQVRGQAEDQLEEFKTNPAVLAEAARQEAEALQSELNELRVVVAQLQEQHSSSQTPYQRQSSEYALQVAQFELGRTQDERAADVAEVRSLAGDICMVAGEMTRGVQSDVLNQAREELKAVLENAHADIGMLASSAESVFLHLAESLQARVDELRTEVAGSSAADATLSAEQQALIEKAQHTANELETQLAAVKQDLRNTQQERDALQQQIDAQGSSASELEQALQTARQELQDAENKAADSAAELERLRGDLSEAEDKRRATKNDINELESKHTELEDQVRNLRLELAEAESNVRSLEQSLAAEQEKARSATRAAEDAQAAVEKSARSQTETKEDAERHVAQLEQRLQQAEAERSKAQQQMQELRRASEEAVRRVEDIANEKDDAERAARARQMQTDELEKVINELKDKLAEQEHLFQDQQQAAFAAAKERDELQHERDRLRKDLDDANERAATSTADAERTQSSTNDELSKLKAQLDAQAEGRKNREAIFHEEKLALENKINEMEQAHAIIEERLQETEREYKSLKRRVEIDKNEKATKDQAASERVKTAMEEVEKYRSEREQQDLAISQANELKKSAEQQIAANQAEMEKMRGARDAMQRQMGEAHRQLQAMEEKMKQLAVEHREAEAAWEQERVASDKERQDIIIKLGETEKTLAAAEGMRKQVSEEFAQQSELMGKMKVEFDDMTVKLRHREEEVESLNRRLERMQKDLSNMTSSRDELADKLTTIGANDEMQKRTIANLERQMRDMQAAHQTQVEELKSLLSGARDQILAAKRDLEDHDATDKEIIKELLDQVKRYKTNESEERAASDA